jgi:hypothetical protein
MVESHLIGDKGEIAFLDPHDQHANAWAEPAVVECLLERLHFFDVEGFEPTVARIAEAVDIETRLGGAIGQFDREILSRLCREDSGLTETNDRSGSEEELG